MYRLVAMEEITKSLSDRGRRIVDMIGDSKKELRLDSAANSEELNWRTEVSLYLC